MASPAEDETAERDESDSATELLVQLGRDLSVLALCEAQLAASRNMPEVRRVSRDLAGAMLAALAFLTAFAFANVAAVVALSSVVAAWLAALVLGAAWIGIGAVLSVFLAVRAGRVTGWRWWRIFSDGPQEARRDLEQACEDARRAVRDTLDRVAPAISVEIAAAAVPVAGDVADAALDVGGDLLEASDDIVEAIAEELPGGGVVNQVWDVVLLPGRVGIKVAGTVLRFGQGRR
jgi:hypothetical protein